MTAPQETAPTAGMVVIGNEILSGKIVDTNSPYLCRELNFLGIPLLRLYTIPDDFSLIGKTVREFSECFTWVFTSGGIGPTHDDLTIPAIAAGFDVPVVSHTVLEETIRAHYGDRLTEDHLLMARVPEGAELIDTEGLNYPQVIFRNIFILPGVPQLFQFKFNAIKERFRGVPIALREIYLKADEGRVAGCLREVDERFDGVLIGSYPSFFRKDYSLRVTIEGRSAERVDAALSELESLLRNMDAAIVRIA